jgi:hypothetical protein
MIINPMNGTSGRNRYIGQHFGKIRFSLLFSLDLFSFSQNVQGRPTYDYVAKLGALRLGLHIKYLLST